MTFNPVAFLQALIRLNTTNPPGGEKQCILFIKETLEHHGISCHLYAKDPERPNLFCNITGTGKKLPLLFYGHVDVVPAKKDEWDCDPFIGAIRDGFVYGRGALDMKSGIAMMIALFLKMANQNHDRDLLLLILCDEEVRGEYGAQYMVENHRELFKNVKFAIGEFGGFPILLNGKRTYLIQVAEKQVCWLKVKLRGKGGHASMPNTNGVVYDLARLITKLNAFEFPIQRSELSDVIFKKIADIIDYNLTIDLENSNLENSDLEIQTFLNSFDKLNPLLSAMVRNTANVTVIHAGSKTNVIPTEVELEIDGRLLPGESQESFISVLRQVLDLAEDQVEITNYVQNKQTKVNWTLYSLMEQTIKEMEPDAEVIPLLISGSTDARHFSSLGIQTYGFLPLNLPDNFDVFSKIHGPNECVPVSALSFGIKCLEIFMNKMQSL